MKGISKRNVVLLIAAFLLVIPLSFSFSGSGDGYNLTSGVVGQGVGSGEGDGYNITLGLYDLSIGSGSGDGYNATFGFYYFEAIEGENLTDCKTSGWVDDATYNVVNQINAGGDCMVIDADNVTLNCRGYLINGSGNGYGVSIISRSDIYLANCRIYNFYGGTYLNNSRNNTFSNNVMGNNTYGLYLYNSSGNDFSDTTTNNNAYGIYLSSSSLNNTFSETQAESNSYDGIYISSDSENNSFDDTRACSNNQSGGSYYDINDQDANSFNDNTCDKAHNATCHSPCAAAVPSRGGGGRGCEDECVIGERVCRDGSMYVCTDVDWDACTEWITEECPRGTECSYGVCVSAACREDWVCTEWSECSMEGIQTRQCFDFNDCGKTVYKPAEERECEPPKPPAAPVVPEVFPPPVEEEPAPPIGIDWFLAVIYLLAATSLISITAYTAFIYAAKTIVTKSLLAISYWLAMIGIPLSIFYAITREEYVIGAYIAFAVSLIALVALLILKPWAPPSLPELKHINKLLEKNSAVTEKYLRNLMKSIEKRGKY